MIQETCACGATFKVDQADHRALSSHLRQAERQAAQEWRKAHAPQCPGPRPQPQRHRPRIRTR
jgi:hypothetical protein